MKCNIVKDLLPNYIDNLTNEETNVDIKKHLDDCSNCHKAYEEMLAVIPKEVSLEEKNIDFLKKLKKKILRKNIIIAISTCIVILISFFIFANNYEIPLPYDAYRMSVELVPNAVVTHEDGTTTWENPDYFEPSDYDSEINVLTRVYRGINNVLETSVGRTINRNGKEVRIVYYYYSKTLLTSLFIDSDLQEYSESGTSTGTDMYGDSFDNANYEPQLIEVYYLPVKDIYDKIDTLSDEEYDKLKENRMLVWSGMA